jgi:hypothetical protein
LFVVAVAVKILQIAPECARRVNPMRILIHLSNDTEGPINPSDEVRGALEVLRAAYIKTEGGATVESNGVVSGVVMNRNDSDLAKALAILGQSGIKASIP